MWSGGTSGCLFKSSDWHYFSSWKTVMGSVTQIFGCKEVNNISIYTICHHFSLLQEFVEPRKVTQMWYWSTSWDRVSLLFQDLELTEDACVCVLFCLCLCRGRRMPALTCSTTTWSMVSRQPRSCPSLSERGKVRVYLWIYAWEAVLVMGFRRRNPTFLTRYLAYFFHLSFQGWVKCSDFKSTVKSFVSCSCQDVSNLYWFKVEKNLNKFLSGLQLLSSPLCYF